jgi:SAM-dependent methyltransferase
VSRTTLKQLRDGGRMPDRDFDEVYPKWARTLSRTHWTPVDVAARAAAFLTETGGEEAPARVLDVGSGVGKFCLVGALTTPGIFTGAELRPKLAALASEVARRYSVKRCTFTTVDAFALDWQQFDGFYLYNPFAEHLPGSPVIDEDLSRAPDKFHKYVNQLEARLETLPEGARLATYHGFGGRMPFEWAPVTTMRLHGGSLNLWQKTRP